MDKISVIMCCYNCEKFVANAVSSILNQTYDNLEILIIDDCSTDKTFEILTKLNDRRITLYKNEVNIGYLLSFNKMIKKCTGNYITFQDADDWSTKERIELLYNEFKKNENLMLCGSSYTRYYSEKKSKDVILPSKNHILKNELINGRFPFCGSSVMIAKEVYKKVGGYREYFSRKGGEDIDWIIRISEVFQVSNINKCLYVYRKNYNSVSSNINNVEKYINQEVIRYLHKERLKNGKDSIESSDFTKINNFIDKLKLNIDSTKINFKYKILEFAEKGSYKIAFLLFLKMLILYPVTIETYIILVRIIFNENNIIFRPIYTFFQNRLRN